MSNDEKKPIIICSSVIQQIYKDKENEKGPQTVSIASTQREGYTEKNEPFISLKLEGEWPELDNKKTSKDNERVS